MVQSSRLTIKPHPILPLVVLVILAAIFLTLFYKPLSSKLLNTYGSYQAKRAELIQSYNANSDSLANLVNKEKDDLDTYEYHLVQAKTLLLHQIDLLNQINELNNKTVGKLITQKDISELQSNTSNDAIKLSQFISLQDQINKKLSSISSYNAINDFDNCIKTADKSSDITICQGYLNKIIVPASIPGNYKNLAQDILNNYFKYDKVTRSKKINQLVKFQNQMVTEFEKVINESILIP